MSRARRQKKKLWDLSTRTDLRQFEKDVLRGYYGVGQEIVSLDTMALELDVPRARIAEIRDNGIRILLRRYFNE